MPFGASSVDVTHARNQRCQLAADPQSKRTKYNLYDLKLSDVACIDLACLELANRLCQNCVDRLAD